MSARFVLSPKARIDLNNIWVDTVKTWGADQAETYVRRLRHHIESIASAPEMGRACPEVRAGYRKYLSGSHMLFYKIVDDGIDVVRILHERMDFGQHL